MDEKLDMHKKPIKTRFYLHPLVRIASYFSLLHSKNKIIRENYKHIKGGCLVLSNHMSFEDIKMLQKVIFPRRSYYVVSIDEFIDKEWILRHLGCIPKKVHYTDMAIIRNIIRLLKKRNLVTIFPEATYSFAGTTNQYEKDLGKLAKMANVPVLVIRLNGSYLYSPRWNTLPKNKEVPIIANTKIVVNKDEVSKLTADEIQQRIDDYFKYDEYEYQRNNNIEIYNKTKANGIEKILYRCPHCLQEKTIIGINNTIKCTNCGASYDIDNLSILHNTNGDTLFDSISKWFLWQRDYETDHFDTFDITFPVKISKYLNAKDGFDHNFAKGVARQNKNGIVVDGKINNTNEDFHFEYNEKLNSLIHLTYDVKGCKDPGVEVHDEHNSYLLYPQDKTPIVKIRFGVEIAHQNYLKK